jgi:hypothetical protein
MYAAAAVPSAAATRSIPARQLPAVLDAGRAAETAQTRLSVHCCNVPSAPAAACSIAGAQTLPNRRVINSWDLIRQRSMALRLRVSADLDAWYHVVDSTSVTYSRLMTRIVHKDPHA